MAVIGTGNNVAAIVANNGGGSLMDCYSTGWIAGASVVGGIVGYSNGALVNCYSTCFISGTISGGTSGGLVGQNDSAGKVAYCYSTGSVISGGGLVGYAYNSSSFTSCFWDQQTSGQAGSAGGTGETTDQMQTPATFVGAGWDFRGESANGLAETWQMPPSGGYPVLSLFQGYVSPSLTGSGSSEDPFVITSAADLVTVYHHPRSSYRLAATLDLVQTKWSLPVGLAFFGTFDGDHHAIRHLTVKGDTYVGLFTQLWSGSHVKNLGIEDANIVGTSYIGCLAGAGGGDVANCYSTGLATGSSYTAGLLGSNTGTVTSCYSTASVAGTTYVGGLLGSNTATVTGCYSTASVTGTSYVGGLVALNTADVASCCSAGSVKGLSLYAGGLVGYSTGNVKNCYSTASVDANSFVGGLLGDNHGKLANCYSAGLVKGSTYTGGLLGYRSTSTADANCFWDIQTSGRTSSASGLGLPRSMMKMSQTYILYGWDFVSETANGKADIWWINEGKDYPRLSWERIAGGPGAAGN